MTGPNAGRKRAKFWRGRPFTPAASYIRRVAAVLVLLMSAVLMPTAPASASPVPHEPFTVTFDYSGAATDWTVPGGVQSVTVEAWGAGTEGVPWDIDQTDTCTGGRGGYAKRSIAVTGGEVLRVVVGGQPSYYVPGFNGGGYGSSTATTEWGGRDTRAGGAGASDVRQGGVGLAQRAIVAGGAGGCSISYPAPAKNVGGDGGGVEGARGGDATTFTASGSGGTQVGGGVNSDPDTRRYGTLGQGGGFYSTTENPHGAGGGGGYYGGAGSKYYGGGGGGSGYAPGGELVAGVRVGHGLIKITYYPTNPPSSVDVLAPTSGTRWTSAVPQEFAVQATDPNGDDYRAEIRIKNLATNETRELQTGRVASGATAKTLALPPLTSGAYQWSVRACDYPPAPYPAWCGPYSAWMDLFVDNPPEATQAMPREGHQFAAGATQAFSLAALDPDGDAYTGTVEVRDGGDALLRSVNTPSTGSGSTATAELVPALPAGSYKWRARACQTNLPSSCSGWSGYRNFSVATPALSPNQPPGTPTQVSPADGYQFAQGESQTFAVTATDPEGDNFTATIRVKTSTGIPIEFKSGSTASGGNASASPPQRLPQGSYTWDARACASASSSSCSSWSPTRSFTVAGSSPGPNQAPGAPEIVAPTANSIYDAGERQDFAVRASDPNGDAYTGNVQITDWSNGDARTVSMTPTSSGGVSHGTLGANGLTPGTYQMQASAQDVHGAIGPSTSQLFGVASADVSPCDGSSPLVDGWFGDRYLRLAATTAADVAYLCVRTVQGAGVPISGWLRAEAGSGGTGGGPTVSTSTVCADGADGVFPLVDLGTGAPPNQPNHLWARLRVSGSAATGCFKVKASGSNILDTAVTISAPQGAELTDLNFVPESLPADWTPPPPVAPTAGLPSSECYAAANGKTLLVNAAVNSQHTWLYQHADTTGTRLCTRIQGAQQRGVVVRVPSGAGGAPAYSLITGRPADDAAAPCTETELHASAPAALRLRHTGPAADPVGLCVYVGTGTSGGVSAWLTADRSPDAAVPTVQSDP